MRCKKCGAGLTWLAGAKTWYCEFCRIEYPAEAAKSITLDQFMKPGGQQ